MAHGEEREVLVRTTLREVLIYLVFMFILIFGEYIQPRDCSGGGVTGQGGYGDVTAAKIFTGAITGDKILIGEAFSPVDTLKISDFQLFFTVCSR